MQVNTDLMWSALEASDGNPADISMAIDLLLEESGGIETALIRTLRWMMQNDRWPQYDVRVDIKWWWSSPTSSVSYRSKRQREVLPSLIANILDTNAAIWHPFYDFQDSINCLARALSKTIFKDSI